MGIRSRTRFFQRQCWWTTSGSTDEPRVAGAEHERRVPCAMLDDPIPALKRRLANEILQLADHTNMYVAARRFGIDVPRMSTLRRGRIGRFSVERLTRILATVDRRVDVNVVAITSASIRWFVGLPKRRHYVRHGHPVRPRRRPR